MNQPRPAYPALAGFLIAATLIAGCGATPAPTTGSAGNGGPAISAPVISTPPNPATTPGPATAPIPGDRGKNGSRSTTPAAGLPLGWPADVPVPPGSITGSTGTNGQWTVAILAAGPAMQARQSAVAFYLAAGFTAVTDSVLNRGNRQITLVAENRDHSATETTLVIQLGTT